jgi:thioredoxin 1
MVDIDKDKVIADYFQVAVVPAVLFIRDQAGIHAQDGELGAPAFDEMIKWARAYDMTEVKNYLKNEDKKT